MDVVMKEQLVEAGMPAAQADVLASHMPEWPDWSQFATKTDLKELATKADLKELELNLRDQMSSLKTDLGGQHLALQGQMLDLKTDLTGQMLGIKSGLNWRLWLPVATSVATAFAAVAAIYVALTLSQLLSNLP